MTLLSLDTLLKLAEQGHFHREHNHDGGNCDPCAMLIGCLADLRTLAATEEEYGAPERARTPCRCGYPAGRHCTCGGDCCGEPEPEPAAASPEAPPPRAPSADGTERCEVCGHPKNAVIHPLTYGSHDYHRFRARAESNPGSEP